MDNKNWLCLNWEDIFQKRERERERERREPRVHVAMREDAKKEIRTKRQKVNQVIGSEKVRGVSECNKSKNICVIYYSHYLFSLVFLSNWEGKIMWAQRDYFPHHFLSLLFSLSNQIRKNFIFHHIFLSFFSILSIKLALFLNMPSLLHQ